MRLYIFFFYSSFIITDWLGFQKAKENTYVKNAKELNQQAM